jgi:putative sigma-54 modulation protein
VNVKEKVIEVKLHLPGADIFTSQNGHHFEEALELAYDQIKGQIIKHKEKHS